MRLLGTLPFLVVACLMVAAFPLAVAANKKSDMQNKMASAGAPSVAAQPFAVVTAQSIGGIINDLHTANKLQNLMSGDNIGYRVFIQHEQDVSTNQAEVHDNVDDIFIILEGAATFVLGGRLDAPKEIQPGEWRASGITGGKEFKVGKGDVVIVPRGTPHRRITTGQDVTLMVVKASAPVNK